MDIKVVELFAGVGGFRVGLEAASEKFNTIWANQWEPGKKQQHAYNCYVSHFGIDSCVNNDINKVKHTIPNHDLLVGGFPCQDYSVAATGAKGIQGKKGVLWWDIRDIAEQSRPKYILLENVDRLLKSPASQRGRDFGIILKSLNDLGYAVQWRVINAAEFGHVQRRRRVFIFACHESTAYYKQLANQERDELVTKNGFFAKGFPSANVDKKRVTHFDLNKVADLVEMTESFKCQFWNAGVCIAGEGVSMEMVANTTQTKTLGEIVEDGFIDESYFLNKQQEDKIMYLRGSKKILRLRPNGEEYYYSEGAMSPYDDLSMPARTMLTSESTINRSTHIIKDLKTGKLRRLTQVECERLNGFPDNWTNSGMPQKFRYFCMGNALVVPLITKMGQTILEIENVHK